MESDHLGQYGPMWNEKRENDFEKCVVRFKWFTKVRKRYQLQNPVVVVVRNEYLRTSLGSPLIENKPAYELN
jgi:hypothetical protein